MMVQNKFSNVIQLDLKIIYMLKKTLVGYCRAHKPIEKFRVL